MDSSTFKFRIPNWRTVVGLALLGLGLMGFQGALAQIHLTKHNLTGSDISMERRSGASSQICVFCHTPFGSDTSSDGPLWNRSLDEKSYNTYNSLGTSGISGVAAPIGSVSMACLSCHDGVQATNVMINTSDNVNAAKELVVGGDTRNDHPVGVQYGGGATALSGPPQLPGPYSKDLMRDKTFSSAQMTILNGQPVWWVDSMRGNFGVRDKADIQLYTRTDSMSLSGPAPFVECASCHDPHSAAALFLRVPNVESAICKSCHAK